MTRPNPSLDDLLDAVVHSAQADLRRQEDQALNRRRELIAQAEDHVRALEEAAREIGRTRGRAAQASYDAEARAEAEGVVASAFERLFERFQRRVQLALEGLPESPRYPEALRAWAAAAASRMTGPTEVFAAARDREAVYDALLAADARDFQVRVERRIGCGFVVRDLDGRTLIDLRPQALVEEHDEALRDLLSARIPPPPAL